jgi:hypothetical protein
MEKPTYIFICFIPGTGEYFAGRQRDIDLLITQFETNDKDLPFTTVAKIKERFENGGVPMGFGTELIEWYNKEKMPDRRNIDLAVMAIIHFLQNGFIF